MHLIVHGLRAEPRVWWKHFGASLEAVWILEVGLAPSPLFAKLRVRLREARLSSRSGAGSESIAFHCSRLSLLQRLQCPDCSFERSEPWERWLPRLSLRSDERGGVRPRPPGLAGLRLRSSLISAQEVFDPVPRTVGEGPAMIRFSAAVDLLGCPLLDEAVSVSNFIF